MAEQFVLEPRKKVTEAIRAAVKEACDNQCFYCCTKLELDWHVDHIKAYSKGGASDFRNYAAACVKCNLSKSDLNYFDYYRLLPGKNLHSQPRCLGFNGKKKRCGNLICIGNRKYCSPHQQSKKKCHCDSACSTNADCPCSKKSTQLCLSDCKCRSNCALKK